MSAVIGALRAVLSLESAAFSTGLSRAEIDLKQFDKRMKAIGSGLQKIGAAVSVLGAGIAAAMKSQLNHADEMGKAAQKFGVPVEALSRLNHAADLSDVSLETLGAAFKNLSLRMATNVSSFADVGIAVRDAEGTMRPAEAVLGDIADRFAAMPDGAEKTALAVRLFGKAGAEMIPMLNGGGDALAEMGAEADALGLTITGETARAAETFNDNVRRLWLTLRGITAQIAADLAPTMADLSEKAVALSQWFRDLSPATREWAATIGLFTIALGPALVAVGTLISSLGALRAVLAGIAAMLAANPIVLAILAIAGAAWLIYSNWGPIKEFFADLWTDITATFDAAWAAIGQGAEKAKIAVVNFWADLKSDFAEIVAGVKDAFDEGWEAVKATTKQWVTDFTNIGKNIVDGLKAGVKERWEAFTGFFTGLVDGLVGGTEEELDINSPSKVFQDIGSNITEGLSLGLSQGVAGVETAMAGVVAAVSGATGSLAAALDDVNEWGKTTFSGLLSGTTTLGEALDALRLKLIDTFASEAWDSLWTALFGTETTGGLLSGLFAKGAAFDGGRVTAFASGGVVTGPTVFPMAQGIGLMGEAGPEAIMPLTRGADGVLGVRAMGGAGRQIVINQTINVQAGVSQTVRAEMIGLMPEFKEQAIRGVIEANRRGGMARAGLK